MKHLLTVLFLAISLNNFAQYEFPQKELCEEMQKRILAVQLLDGDNESNKNLNSALKSVMDENWKWTAIEYISSENIEKILKEKNTKYAVLTQHGDMREDVRSGFIDENGRPHRIGVAGGNQTFKYTAFTFSFYNFELLLPNNKKSSTITEIGFANSELTRIDYIYLAQQLNHLISNSLKETPMKEFFNVERNNKACTERTLVILKDFIREKEISDISKYYEHPYKLVDFDQYQDIIINKKPGYGYAKIIWSNQLNMYAWVVADSETGETISLLTFGGVKFGRHHDANDIIKVNHLKYVTSKMQKINNKYK